MTDDVRVIELARLSPAERGRLLMRAESDLAPIIERVRAIIEAVRAEGDEALARFAREYDQAELTADRIAVSEDEFERAFARIDPALREAISFAIGNIRRFHEAQMPKPLWFVETQPGVLAGERIGPIPSVACYVPRGKGAFPSVMMMTTVPARVAGVPEIAVLTPPTPDGSVDDASLVAARLSGVERIFKCGGAAAVAAAAYGTQSVPRCSKILGPGSPWVVAAKRLLADRIDVGLPAGPSESILLADASADPRIAAMDLLIEAEHGPDSAAYLVTDSRKLAEAAAREIPELWKRMGETRAAYSRAVLSGPRGGILIARDMAEAIAFVNDFAPEHLEILTEDPWDTAALIEHAGEILLGPHTPITLGNFVIGPNCVLPTGGHARTFSPLSVHDFLKRSSIARVAPRAYPELARHAYRLARFEGFDAHAHAVSELRFRAGEEL